MGFKSGVRDELSVWSELIGLHETGTEWKPISKASGYR